jgi:hypothetical protein
MTALCSSSSQARSDWTIALWITTAGNLNSKNALIRPPFDGAMI